MGKGLVSYEEVLHGSLVSKGHSPQLTPALLPDAPRCGEESGEKGVVKRWEGGGDERKLRKVKRK